MTRIRFDDCPEDKSQDSTWTNPAKLSRKVRELAHRSHRALGTGPRPEALVQADPKDAAGDLRDLRDQIARLQQKIHERRLNALIPWVDALDRQVQDRLELARKAGTR
jgi:hypothetical protein